MFVLTAIVHERLLLILSLFFAIGALYMLSSKLRISYPIVLVIGGLLISLVPGMPTMELDPDLVFLIFLPPLLYEAAWSTSWREFWSFRRPISLLAFGLVFVTSCVVAYVSNAMIPGFTLAMGFLLGGIISPPDAVAATSVLGGLKVPKRVVTILEGESLVNDASSLIVFRFALAAILTSQFALVPAIGNFFLVAGAGVLIGVAIAYVVYLIHRYLPTTPTIDVALTLVTPYIMYLAAEEAHVSGVMSVVSGGLFLTHRSSDFMNFQTRIQANGVWDTMSFLLNGFVFILIGLQLPMITSDLGMPPGPALVYAIVISVITILLRIAWVFPATYVPRWIIPSIGREPYPSPKAVFLVAWAGMRGVVSLASALAVPLTLTDGTAFPYRNFILFCTFVVILITLVLQGITLPALIRAMDFPDDSDPAATERLQRRVRASMSNAVVEHLDAHYQEELQRSEFFARLRHNYDRLRAEQEVDPGQAMDPALRATYKKALIELIHVRRAVLKGLRCDTESDLEMVREWEETLDFEEARIHRTYY